MSNKEGGNYRPHYYAIQDKANLDLYWMIPISSQTEKYKRILEKKIERYGKCNTIVIGKFGGRESAFLIQNAFPIIERYLHHVHTIQGQPIVVHKELNKVLTKNLRDVLAMYDAGVKLLFANVQEIRCIMEQELQNNPKKLNDIDATKDYIDSLNRECLSWHRMLTAYGTAKDYNELLEILEQTLDVEEWGECFDNICDFEHQGTMFPPAPFVMVFLVRILEKLLSKETTDSDVLAKRLVDKFIYYVEVCVDAEQMQHAQPLNNFADMLAEKYLLSEELDEEGLMEIFEEPEVIPADLFYSFYYYSKIVLMQVPKLLDGVDKYIVESKELKRLLCI